MAEKGDILLGMKGIQKRFGGAPTLRGTVEAKVLGIVLSMQEGRDLIANSTQRCEFTPGRRKV